MFLQAAEMSGMQAQFDLPGFTATILAPSDAAFTTFLNGTASQYVELVVPKRSSLLAQLLSLALGLALAPAPAHAPAARAWLYPCLRSCPCPFSFSFPSVALFLFFLLPIRLVSELFTEAISGMWHASTPVLYSMLHAACMRYAECPASLPVEQSLHGCQQQCCILLCSVLAHVT